MNFPYTCSVAKPSGATNSLKERSKALGTPVDDLPCNYSVFTHKQVDPGLADLVQVSEEIVFFPIGTDVQKGDQITNIAFWNGDPVTPKKFDVEVSMERVSPTMGRMYVAAAVRSLS